MTPILSVYHHDRAMGMTQLHGVQAVQDSPVRW